MRTLNSFIPIEIQEVTKQQFPIALVTNQYETWFEEDCEKTFRMVARPLRYFENSFWVQVRANEIAGSKAPGYACLDDFWDYLSNCIGRTSVVKGEKDEPELFDAQKSIILSDNEELAQKLITNVLKDYLIFSGGLWKRTEEPVYTFTTFEVGFNGGTYFQIGNYSPVFNEKFFFNALERKKAISFVKDIAIKRGDTIDAETIGKNAWIDVILPETVKWMRAIPPVELGTLTQGDYSLQNVKVSFLDEGFEQPTPFLHYKDTAQGVSEAFLDNLPELKIERITNVTFGIKINSSLISEEYLPLLKDKIETYSGFVELINKGIRQNISN